MSQHIDSNTHLPMKVTRDKTYARIPGPPATLQIAIPRPKTMVTSDLDSQLIDDAMSGDQVVTMSPKAQLMKEINKSIPLNKDYNLPEFIYRADLLPANLNAFLSLEPVEQGDALEVAIVELEYSQGFPTLYEAEPLWARLPCESVDAYRVFTKYLEMPRGGDEERHFADTGDRAYKERNRDQTQIRTTINNNYNIHSSPVRQLHTLKHITNKSSIELLSMMHMFYWQARSTAYDAFQIATHSKLKEHRLIKAELKHYDMANEFTQVAHGALFQRLSNPGEDEKLSNRELLEVIKFCVQLERLSLGVSPFSPANPNAKDPNALPQNASLEVIMRTLTQQAQQQLGPANAITDQSNMATQKLFQNPDDLKQAQELIIRMQNSNQPRKTRQMSFDNPDGPNTAGTNTGGPDLSDPALTGR